MAHHPPAHRVEAAADPLAHDRLRCPELARDVLVGALVDDPRDDRLPLVRREPLDEQRRAEVIVINAFTARAAVLPSWAEFIRTGYDELAGITAQYIAKAQSSGDVRDDLNLRVEDL